MTVMRSLGGLLLFVGVSCGKAAPSPTPTPLPASAAGMSTAVGPGVPAGFSGKVRNSIELTDEQRAAIAKANELSEARAEDARIRTSLRTTP